MVVRPTSLISEQILIILPARFRIIRLEASRETSMALVRLVRSTSFHVPKSTFSRLILRWMPALLMSTSTPPWESRISNASATSASLVMSKRASSALKPC